MHFVCTSVQLVIFTDSNTNVVDGFGFKRCSWSLIISTRLLLTFFLNQRIIISCVNSFISSTAPTSPFYSVWYKNIEAHLVIRWRKCSCRCWLSQSPSLACKLYANKYIYYSAFCNIITEALIAVDIGRGKSCLVFHACNIIIVEKMLLFRK